MTDRQNSWADNDLIICTASSVTKQQTTTDSLYSPFSTTTRLDNPGETTQVRRSRWDYPGDMNHMTTKARQSKWDFTCSQFCQRRDWTQLNYHSWHSCSFMCFHPLHSLSHYRCTNVISSTLLHTASCFMLLYSLTSKNILPQVHQQLTWQSYDSNSQHYCWQLLPFFSYFLCTSTNPPRLHLSTSSDSCAWLKTRHDKSASTPSIYLVWFVCLAEDSTRHICLDSVYLPRRIRVPGWRLNSTNLPRLRLRTSSDSCAWLKTQLDFLVHHR